MVQQRKADTLALLKARAAKVSPASLVSAISEEKRRELIPYV